MNMKVIRAGVAAALCATAFFAHGANVTLTGWTYGSGHDVSVSNPGFNGQAGGFTGSLSGSGGFDTSVFTTYCVELTEYFSFSKNAMTGYSVVSGSSYFGDATSQRLDKLFTYLDSHPNAVDTSAESTSLQLAIWNLVYDKDSTLASGTFKDRTSYADYATLLLTESDKVTTSDYNIYALQKSGSQDFLLISHIPEPSSIALVCAALGAMGWASRRKRGASA